MRARAILAAALGMAMSARADAEYGYTIARGKLNARFQGVPTVSQPFRRWKGARSKRK